MKDRPIIMSTESVRAILAGRKTQTRRVLNLGRVLVHVPRLVKSEIPPFLCGGARALPGAYPVEMNPQGAVAAMLLDGKLFGLKPGEFDFMLPGVVGRTFLAPKVDGSRWGTWTVMPTERCRRWVKEAWATSLYADDQPPACVLNHALPVWYQDGTIRYFGASGGGPTFMNPGKLRSPLFMPRALSRLTLEVIEVRIQRLHAITEEDARAEGMTPNWAGDLAGWDPDKHGFLVPCKTKCSDDCACCYEGTARECYSEAWDRLNARRRPGIAWKDNPWVVAYTFRKVEDGNV